MHIFKYFFKTSLCLSALVVSQSAFSWWDQSHQLIGSIAGQNVSEITRKQVLELLSVGIERPGSITVSLNTNGFDTASSWADVIKPYHSAQNTCHYLDLSLYPEEIGKEISDENAHERYLEAYQNSKLNSAKCLEGFIKTLVDDKQSTTQKAIALRFVMHIVEDMVQPLHNVGLVSNGMHDRGGNLTNFSEFVWIPTTVNSGSTIVTLHGLWDASLADFLQFPYIKSQNKIGFYNKSDLQLNQELGEKLQKNEDFKYVANALATSAQSIEKWVIDGFRVSAKYVYTDTDKNWDTYALPRMNVVESQIAKGSYRLAFLLNAIFDAKKAPQSFQDIVNEIKDDKNITPFIVK